jgi:prepilin-type N-terminal cleavage/methylation domain-containing protein
MRRRGAIRRLRTDQSGFTVVELLMAMIIGLMIIAIAATVFTAVSRSQPGQLAEQARTSMERLTREIRQGSTVYPSSASSLSLLTYVHSQSCGGPWANTAIQCKVTYTCTSGTCTRAEAPPPPATGSGPATPVVTGLSGSSVFSYTPTCDVSSTSGNPGYVCVTLTFPGSGGDDAITLQDGATPVNATAP